MTIEEQFNAIPKEDLPKHVAIIPNGNRTWARLNGKTAMEGHNTGVEVLIKFARVIREWGIHTATVWGSSTENLVRRDPKEIANLFKLLNYVLETMGEEAHEDGVRLIHVGNKSKLPGELVKKIEEWEEKTKDNKNFVANIAFAYGGHDELFRGMRKAFKDIEDGKIKYDDLLEVTGLYQNKYPYHRFKDYLDTLDQPYPYPDLIIRTAGEHRLSGFMPWQAAYSEYYSTEKLMPEMTEEEFQKAIISYVNRDRSFGGDKEKTVEA
ncbi:polyprenyl diphosphate synthase [Patescibacteria group bacterium]